MKSKLQNAVLTSVLFILGAVVILPALWLLVLSLKNGEGFSFSLKQYGKLFTDGGTYFYVFLRSLLVTLAIAIGQTIVAITVGFLFGKFSFRARFALLVIYVIVLFLPYSATLLPNYMILREMRLLNTQVSIILPAIFSPLSVIIMTIFVSSVPDETLEAALLETKKLSDILFHIVIPQITPGIALTMMITFTEAWNMVEQPQAMMENKLLHPLSVSLNSFFAGSADNFAGAFVYLLPPLLLLWSYRDSLQNSFLKGSSPRKQRKEEQNGK